MRQVIEADDYNVRHNKLVGIREEILVMFQIQPQNSGLFDATLLEETA